MTKRELYIWLSKIIDDIEVWHLTGLYSLVQWIVYTFHTLWGRIYKISHQKCKQFAEPYCILGCVPRCLRVKTLKCKCSLACSCPVRTISFGELTTLQKVDKEQLALFWGNFTFFCENITKRVPKLAKLATFMGKIIIIVESIFNWWNFRLEPTIFLLTRGLVFCSWHCHKFPEFISALTFTASDLARALTENSPVSGSSLKKAEIFYGYFEIYCYPKWVLER